MMHDIVLKKLYLSKIFLKNLNTNLKFNVNIYFHIMKKKIAKSIMMRSMKYKTVLKVSVYGK